MKVVDTILKQLEVASIKYADSPYMLDKTDNGWVANSYKDVKEKSQYLSVALNNLGLEKDNSLAILSESRTNWVISEFAILFNGAISVPLSVKLLEDELPFRINHSKAKGIFVSKNHLQKVVNIWEKIDVENFYLIYLDEDIEFLEKITCDANIPKSQIKSYSKLLKEGESNYTKYQHKMKSIENSISENDTVTISYTSGTTGNPKGIMLTHKNYCSNSADGVKVFKVKEHFKTLIILPIDHCFAHTVAIFGALFSGMTLYFLDTRGGAVNALKNIPINLKDVKPDFLLTVPALSGNLMNKMIDGISKKGWLVQKLFNKGINAGIKLNKDGYKKSSFYEYLRYYPIYFVVKKIIFSKFKDVFGGKIKYLVGGGALLDIKQQQFFYAIGVPIFQGYGLTEATPIISSNSPFSHKLGTSGFIMPSVNCYIKREDGSICDTYEKGEIVISGDNVMKGYFKNEEATSESIKNDLLYTGDLGYYDSDGFLVVTGREKALLIAEDGEKYSPEEIEEGLANSSPLIFQVNIHNNQRKYTCAIITLDELAISSLIKKDNISNVTELYSIIKGEIEKFKSDKVYKAKFPSRWMPSIFFIAPEVFDEENKMVNSTLKMVRYKIESTYSTDINDMYGNNAIEITENKNIATIEKMFFSI